MKKILVTGGGGYIGTVLIPLLLEEGCRVTAVDRFFFGLDRLAKHPNLEIVREDCRRLPWELLEGVDGVIDLVAISNDPSGELFQETTWATNHECRVRTASMAKEAGVSR